jgi:hypothetical protein
MNSTTSLMLAKSVHDDRLRAAEMRRRATAGPRQRPMKAARRPWWAFLRSPRSEPAKG